MDHQALIDMKCGRSKHSEIKNRVVDEWLIIVAKICCLRASAYVSLILRKALRNRLYFLQVHFSVRVKLRKPTIGSGGLAWLIFSSS